MNFSEREQAAAVEPTVRAFLADGGYSSVDEWMADSDFIRDADGTWRHEIGHPVDAIDCILTAIEACGFTEET